MKSEIEELDSYQEDDPWNNGIVCAFEFIGAEQQDKGRKNPFASSSVDDLRLRSRSVSTLESGDHVLPTGQVERCDRWMPIGWRRIAQLAQRVPVPVNRDWSILDIKNDHDGIEQNLISIKDLAPPYQEQAGGPVWWCCMSSKHPFVEEWFCKAKWIHPAVKLALHGNCNCKLSSKLMVDLPYEVPVRVAGGLLFKLRTRSFGDRAMYPDGSVVDLCSWQQKNFLVTLVDLDASKVYVPGISSLKELLNFGGDNLPITVHELTAHLISSLVRWDYRFYNFHILDGVQRFELAFRKRDSLVWAIDIEKYNFDKDLERLTITLVDLKDILEANEEICSELLQHLRGSRSHSLLEGVIMRTKEMLGKQVAARDRLFSIHDAMQNNRNAVFQEESTRISHNLGIFGGCGLLISLVLGLFGVNLRGIPLAHKPYAFGLFSAIVVFLAAVMIGVFKKFFAFKSASEGARRAMKRRMKIEEDIRRRESQLDSLLSNWQVKEQGET